MVDGRTIARASAATLGGQWARFAVQGLGLVVLARLVPPEEFGRLAMIVAFVGVANVLSDFGLFLAAVRTRSLSHEQSTNLFWLNTLVGMALAAVVFLLAPAIAAFYADPGLVHATQQLGVVFVLNGVACQFKAELNRRLRLSILAVAEAASQVVALAVAVIVALDSPDLRALVLQQVVAAAALLAIVVPASRLWPGLPVLGVSVRSFLTFGLATTATQLLNYVSSNVDSLLVGRTWGAEALGVYNRAFQIFLLPLQQLASPMTRVVLPVLVRVQDDRPRYVRYLAAGQLLLCYVLVPALAFLAGAAEPVMRVVLGEPWVGGAPVLRALAVGGVFQILGYVYYWTFLAEAKMPVLLVCEGIGRVAMVGLMVAVAPIGVVAIAWAYAGGLVLVWAVTGLAGMRRTDVSAAALTRVAVRPVLVSLWVAAALTLAGRLLDGAHPVVQLAVSFCVAVLAYCSLLVVRPVRRDLGVVLRFVRMVKGRPEAVVVGAQVSR